MLPKTKPNSTLHRCGRCLSWSCVCQWDLYCIHGKGLYSVFSVDHSSQLLPEPPPAQTVQDKVEGIVGVGDEVDDDPGQLQLVSTVHALRRDPLLLSDQEDGDGGRGAQEHDANTEQDRGHGGEFTGAAATVGCSARTSAHGRRGVVVPRATAAGNLHQSALAVGEEKPAHDGHVTHQDDQERNEGEQAQVNPRPDTGEVDSVLFVERVTSPDTLPALLVVGLE